MLQEKIKKQRQSQGGFTLLETMISAAIFAVLAGGVSVFIQRSNDQVLAQSVIGARGKIAKLVEKNLSDYSKLAEAAKKGSGSGNLALANCLEKAGTCDVTSAVKQVPFNFTIKYSGKNIRLAGTETQPVRYGKDGAPNCIPNTGQGLCPFWNVTTYFWATCPGGKTSCDEAATVNVRYIVKPVKPTYNDFPIESFPNAKKFKDNPSSFAIGHTVARSNLALGLGQTCPVGAMQIGFEAGGKIKCACRAGFKDLNSDPTKPPNCLIQDLLCKRGELLQGRKGDGTPICRAVTIKCDKNFAFSSEDATCPNGGWLEAIDLGYCKPGKKGKKSSARGITCDKNKGHCCWYEPI